MRRFEQICDVVESAEEYRVGDYHLVHLEDTFHQQYQIVGKLELVSFLQFGLPKTQNCIGLALFLYNFYYHQTYTFLSRLQIFVILKILKTDTSKDS